MADPLTRAGGSVPWAENEKITSVGLTRMGTLGLQTVMNGIMGRLLRESVSDDPDEGVFGSSDLEVTMTDDLEATVGIGAGFVFKAAADAYSPDYQMFALDAPVALALAAHDPANPRIDRVVVSSAYADELAENHDVKDPVSGTIASTPEYTRRRVAAICQVVTGTPAASPSAPATPADYISLATVAVPAASGAGVATDTRNVVRFAIEKVAGDLEMSGQVTFALPLGFERPMDMAAICAAVSAGGLLVSGTGTWAAVYPPANTANIDGDGATYPRPRLELTSPAVNDEINIPLDNFPAGCGLSHVVVIAEADQGTVTMDARLGALPHDGTDITLNTIDDSNTDTVVAAGRNSIELEFDPDVALTHGQSNGSGAQFYNLRLRVTAVAGSPGKLVVYGIIPVWSTTQSRSAWGYTAQ